MISRENLNRSEMTIGDATPALFKRGVSGSKNSHKMSRTEEMARIEVNLSLSKARLDVVHGKV